MANETPGFSLDYLARSSNHDAPLKPSSSDTTSSSFPPPPPFSSFHSRIHPPLAMSLRTRESSSMALKHIFDQINSSADNPQALDSLFTRTMPPSFRDEDGRRDGQVSSAADRAGAPIRAHDSSIGRGSEELRDNGDALQRSKGIRSPPLEERNLFPFRSFSDARADEDKRSDMSRRPSPQRSSDATVAKSPAAASVSWQDYHHSEKDMRFGFRMPERIASPPPPPQAVGVNSPQASYKVTLETAEAASELSRQAAAGGVGGGAPPPAFEQWRKRLPDLDVSFRKAPNQDPSTFFSNQTAFGSPISMPAHQSVTDYNTTSPAAPWSIQGAQPHATNSATASRPGTSNSTGRQPTAQLTIFYSGMVNVYDDVPADKAHAIMLLAGTGNSWSTHFMNTPSSDNNNNIRSPSVASSTPGATAPTPALPVTPPSVPASAATTTPPRAVAYASPPAPTNPTSPAVVAPPTAVSVPPPSTTTTSDAKQTTAKRSHTELPHARKASLARFLEKRKDRVQVKQVGSPINQSTEETCDMSTEKPCSPKRQCTGSGGSPSPAKNSNSRGRCSSPSPTTNRSSEQPTQTAAATAFPPQHRFVD